MIFLMRKFLICATCVFTLLTFCGCEETEAEKNDSSFMTVEGWCISCENDSYMIVDENNSPIVMSNDTGDPQAFSQLGTGDIIKIQCEYVEETYPAKTDVLKLELVSQGEASDVPEEIVQSLKELGWEVSE